MKKLTAFLILIICFPLFAQSGMIGETNKLKLKQFASGTKGVADWLNWNYQVIDSGYAGTNTRLNTNITNLKNLTKTVGDLNTANGNLSGAVSELQFGAAFLNGDQTFIGYNQFNGSVTFHGNTLFGSGAYFTLPILSSGGDNSGVSHFRLWVNSGDGRIYYSNNSRTLLMDNDLQYRTIHSDAAFDGQALPKRGLVSGLPSNISSSVYPFRIAFEKKMGDVELKIQYIGVVDDGVNGNSNPQMEFINSEIYINGVRYTLVSGTTFNQVSKMTANISALPEGIYEAYVGISYRTNTNSRSVDVYQKAFIAEVKGKIK